MTERVEWEVVDESPRATRPTPRRLMEMLLGRWWRWKIAGVAIAAALALVLLATVAGVILVLMVAVGCLSFGIGKLTRWLQTKRRLRKRDGSITVRRQTGR